MEALADTIFTLLIPSWPTGGLRLDTLHYLLTVCPTLHSSDDSGSPITPSRPASTLQSGTQFWGFILFIFWWVALPKTGSKDLPSCTSMHPQQLGGPCSNPHWRSILHTSAPAIVAAKPCKQLGQGSVPHTSVPTAVVARHHSQPVCGPAQPTNAPIAIVVRLESSPTNQCTHNSHGPNTTGGCTKPSQGHPWSTWLC